MSVAAFQRFAIAAAPERVADRILRDVWWADRQGVDLALFPEAFLTGHSDEWPRIERCAVSLGDDVVRRLADGLSRFRTTTVFGLFERRETAVYNSAVVAVRPASSAVMPRCTRSRTAASQAPPLPYGNAAIVSSASTFAPISIIQRSRTGWSSKAPA